MSRGRAVGLAAAAALLAAAPAAAQGTAEREAALFGAPASPATDARAAELFGAATAPATAAARDEAIFGGGLSPAAAALPEAVAAADDPLAIGGLLYLRLRYPAARHSDPEDEALSSPNLFDLYLDARPSDRLRGFVRGRLRFEPTAGGPPASAQQQFAPPDTTSVDLDQLWLKTDVARRLYVTAGKQPLRWGVGRFWNPTDFLNPQARDPLAVFDERLGVTLLKLHVPFEAAATNLYAIADLEGARTPEQVGAALRAEWVLGLAEFSISGAVRKDRPTILGSDVSAALGPLDVRLEAAVRHDDRRPFYAGELRFVPPALPTTVDRRDEWIPQVVGGAEYAFNYSDTDSLALGAEVFWNDAGTDEPSLYPWMLLDGTFTPLYAGRWYGAFYAMAVAPGRLDDATFILSTLGNLSDRSYLSRLDARWSPLRFLDLDAAVNLHYGRRGEFNFGLDVPPLPFAPALADGLTIPEPLVDVEVGARLSF